MKNFLAKPHISEKSDLITHRMKIKNEQFENLEPFTNSEKNLEKPFAFDANRLYVSEMHRSHKIQELSVLLILSVKTGYSNF